ncbi:hypothetical protein OFO01_07425 [Campylobacter sp. JMF_01 NE2]|uniref:hypothetical protein n=1 Tax=unclassified Campylobacter TaxID=2593542 RepID=UPI0022E9C46A|nr:MULTISPECIES: hypothetical protein [unclassified Campylobacter]MDA3053205.1 hypothetical protein [Campylobacter sp. JMF_03 NE3]MDA3067612.1 hypothetical protein [Campylobacter sp. JMF_01 NE2]
MNNSKSLIIDKPIFCKVETFLWGKSNNLLCFCKQERTQIRFAFSVFKNDNDEFYDKEGEFDFINYKEKIFPNKPYLKFTFSRNNNGFLICEKAEIKKSKQNSQIVFNEDIILGISQKFKLFLENSAKRRAEWRNKEKQ